MSYTQQNIYEVLSRDNLKPQPKKKVVAAPVKEEPKKAPQKNQAVPQKAPKSEPLRQKNNEQPQKRINPNAAKTDPKRIFEKKPASDNWNEQTSWGESSDASVPAVPSANKPRRFDNTERNDKNKGRRGERIVEEQFGERRAFERRSGTGRNPTENKKGGHGKSNWGADTDLTPVEPEVEKDTEAKAEQTADEIQEETPKVEEKPEMTLQEWREQQAKAKLALDLPQARKPGEGVDQSEWGQYVALPREVEEQAPLAPKKKPVEKKAPAEKPAEKKGPTKVPLTDLIELKAPEDPNRRRGGNRDNRPEGDRRPQGDRQYSGERRDRPQGDRPQGERRERRDQGDRPQGDRQYQGERRPRDNQGGDRDQGDRPQGDRSYQPERRDRDQGDRPQGDRQYERRDRDQGDRPQGDRQYQGERRPRDNQGGERRDNRNSPAQPKKAPVKPVVQPNFEITDENAFPSLKLT